MTNFLLIALLGLAAGAVWVWLLLRRHNREIRGSVKSPLVPPEAVGEEAIDQLAEEHLTEQEEVSQQPNLGVTTEVASNPAVPATHEPQPALPDADATDSDRRAGTSPTNFQPDVATRDAQLADPAEQPRPPTTFTPSESGVRPEILSRSRPRTLMKPEGARHTAPERRGGGQMETEEGALPVAQRNRTHSDPQLRLLCFRGNDRMWRLAVELPEDSSEGGDVDVLQDGKPLERVGFNENRWLLKQLKGIVEAVENRNGGQRWQLDVGNNECFVFKLLEDSETEEGRLVSVPSHGDYLAIAPGDWAMTESSGIQLPRERNVAIDGHGGYRFSVGEGVHPRLEFRQRGVKRKEIQFCTACFTLTGERAAAVFGEYQAPFFLKSPPNVCAPDAESWCQVQKLVLGVAGKGRNKWKKAIKPNPANSEVKLSEHLNAMKGGWYFLRFYDTNERLIDSLYFTFSTAVQGIKALGTSVLPGVGGHTEARLGFEHDTDVTVEILGERRLETQTWPRCTVFIVPASVSWERVDCQICTPGHTPIKCTTSIERIWWALGDEAAQPADTDWIDKPIAGKTEHFRAASDKVLFVRLQSAKLVDSFLVGFTRETARPYYPKAGERNISVRLGDFADSDQVQNAGVWPFRIWVWQRGGEISADILRLEVVYRCCYCARPFRTDVEALAHAIEHEKEFIHELSYEDLRRLNPELPTAIFQCLRPGCGFYAREDDPSNATSVITRHIEETHGGHSYPVHISFRSVTNLDEIRRNVERDLPQIFRCKCGQKFEHVQVEDFADHIFRKHRSQLFNLI